MSDPGLAYITPEARARMQIDRMLAEAGWKVQDYSRANLSAARGVAVREFILQSPHGRADSGPRLTAGRRWRWQHG